MTFTKEQLKRVQTEDGYYSEDTKEMLEKIADKPLDQIEKDAEEAEQTTIPSGHPSGWTRDQKLAVISDPNLGREEYQRLVRERSK